MRFFEHLQRHWLEGNARFWGKQCARVMFFAYSVKWHQYKSTAPTPAWIVRQTLVTRADWRQIGETTMLHDQSGQTVEVADDANLISAIHAVIEIEYGYELSKRVTSWERADMLREAQHAADLYLAKKLHR